MFIFPKDRHERPPVWYRFNIVLILLGFFNMMAMPAYGEIERLYQQRQINQQLLETVSSDETLAALLDEIKTLLKVQANRGDAAYQLLAASDPVLRQGEAKRRQRLAILIDNLPAKYNEIRDSLRADKADLAAMENVALKPVISHIDRQLADMQANYERLMTLLTKNVDGEKSTAAAMETLTDNAQLLKLLDGFTTAPQQQMQTGPSAVRQTKEIRLHSDVRKHVKDFSEEQAISQAQLAAAQVHDAITPNVLKNPLTVPKAQPQKRALPPSYNVSALPGAQNYLGESDEIQLTDRIKEKAEELGYDPVKIYYWVRNNIEFVPTWGAYQTAEHTLGSRQGNAFDTASLLIALLRASNIPARYVHGTISIGPQRFTNWIGDFNDVDAAGNYAASAGMRVTKLLSADRKTVTAIRIEHAWVEAAIDFLPSRGVKNFRADTWLAMDASFKQYEYLQGLDVEQIGGIDAEQLLRDFEASGTSNEAEGWTQGFDAGIIERAQQDAQQRLEAHINNMTDPTVGDVIGGNKVIIKEYPMLSAGLTNEIVVRGTDYIAVPRNYQAQIGLAMRPVLSRGLIPIYQPPIDDELTYYPLSKFNSEKTILRFSPATQADADALEALVPPNATGIDDLPKFIGAGINVIPELVLDGEIVLKGSAMSIGREVQIGYKPRLPNVNQRRPAMAYDVIAGSYLHIPIVGYSVNAFRLLDTRERVEKTQKILEDKDPAQLATLTREDVLGDLFYTGGLGYFAQLHTMNRMAGHYGNALGKVNIGYGSYGYEPKLKQAGILATPVGILPGSIATNMRVHQTYWSKDNTTNDNNIGFTMGMNSSILESAISEQLFCNEQVNPNNEPCYGISTVSGLQRAAQRGQKIYQINRNNKDQLKNIQMSDDNMADDINKAINSGGYVIVPEKAVEGTGRDAIYVYMTDDGSGNQSWKISGGLNGGTFELCKGKTKKSAEEDNLCDCGKSLLTLSLQDLQQNADRLISWLADYTPNWLKYVLKNIYERIASIFDMAGRFEDYANSGCDTVEAVFAMILLYTLLLALNTIIITFITGPIAFIPIIGVPLFLSLFLLMNIMLIEVVTSDYDAIVNRLCSRKKKMK